jgi:hypothetical protein
MTKKAKTYRGTNVMSTWPTGSGIGAAGSGLGGLTGLSIPLISSCRGRIHKNTFNVFVLGVSFDTSLQDLVSISSMFYMQLLHSQIPKA